ncbi:RNA polymerase sigma factor [Rufibacter ruber]|uniref:RNA polymerase sigma factor n=1 Tax=Rufibacter ruber TaxID=1783499 RepID=UPI0008330841|nr:RNA polymerase sigma factor [Rufibacter ruber]
MRDIVDIITDCLTPKMRKVVIGAFHKRFGHSPGDIDEYIQMAAIKVYERFRDEPDTERLDSHLNTYFCTAAINLYIDKGRYELKRPTVRYDALEDAQTFLEPLSVQESPYEEEDQTDYNLALRVLKELPDECRIPLEMYAAGDSYQEIAEQLGWNLNTVKVRIKRGRDLCKINREKLRKREKRE